MIKRSPFRYFRTSLEIIWIAVMMYVGSVRAMGLERGRVPATLLGMTKRSPFRYFRTSPEIVRLRVMLYIRFPLSLRDVEDLLHKRCIEISHEMQ